MRYILNIMAPDCKRVNICETIAYAYNSSDIIDTYFSTYNGCELSKQIEYYMDRYTGIVHCLHTSIKHGTSN